MPVAGTIGRRSSENDAKGFADTLEFLYHLFVEDQPIKIVVQNRKARHDYEILESYEVGIALVGTEVKSIRAGKVQMKDSYAVIEEGELYLHHLHISVYDQGSLFNHDPLRKRKLLMHKQELRKLYSRAVERGLALIPLKVYFRGKVAKVELALARGRKLHDKRDAILERAARREIDRKLKEHRS